jgi:hypothetical protein
MRVIKDYKLLKTLNDEFVVQFKRFCTLPDDAWVEGRVKEFRSPEISWTKWNPAIEYKQHNDLLNTIEFSFLGRNFCFIYYFMSFEAHVLYRVNELVVNRKNIAHREAVRIKELDFILSETGLHYVWKKSGANKISHIGNDFISKLAEFVEIDEDLHRTAVKDPPLGID